MLLNCVVNYRLKAVDNAIKHLNTVSPNNISVDKIEFICRRKDDNKVIQLLDYRDDITNKSYVINMNGNSYRMKETKAWLKILNGN